MPRCTVAGGARPHAGAGQACRLIGDPAVRQSRHHRRLDRQQRSDRRLSRRRASALGATIITNKRGIAADDFFTGMFATALEPAEIITKVSFPLPKKAAYQKFRNQASRYALVGVFVAKRGSDVRVAVTGAGAERRVPRHRVRGGAEEAFSPKSLEGLTVPGRRPEQRHPRQRRISRASDRRARQARRRGGG